MREPDGEIEELMLKSETLPNDVLPNLAMSSGEPTRFRWGIVALLTGISFVSYVERMNISIAAKFMMPEFSLSTLQMGRIFSSFLLGYAICQIPAGLLGDWLGPRAVFAGAAIAWGVTTLLTGMVGGPLLHTGLSVFVSLLTIRFLLGVSESPTYPVAGRVVANWTRASEHALSISLLAGGLSLGSAMTPPLISWLMLNVGWRASFYISSGFAFLMAILWLYYATDSPVGNQRVNQSELALIHSHPLETVAAASAESIGSWWGLFFNIDIMLVTLSYLLGWYVLDIFVFWMYIYLVDYRGFGILHGGVATSLPFVVAAIFTPGGGMLCNALSGWLGVRRGRRWTALGCYALSASMLLAGAKSGSPYLAVAFLSLGFGFAEAAEGAFWATAISLGGPHSGAACGILNTGANLGGVICTALVPVLVMHFGWTFALGSAAAALLVGGLIWLAIQA